VEGLVVFSRRDGSLHVMLRRPPKKYLGRYTHLGA